MSVTFDEEQQIARTPQTGVSGLYALVIRWGFAKDEKQAGMVLLIAIGTLLLGIIGIWIMGSGAPEGPKHEDLIRMQQSEGV